jgi:hypothetical protein
MMVEFGKYFEIPLQATEDASLVQEAYRVVIDDFLKARKDNFPNWFELPEIKVNKALLNKTAIGWYIAVPEDQVYQEDESLWDQ